MCDRPPACLVGVAAGGNTPKSIGFLVRFCIYLEVDLLSSEVINRPQYRPAARPLAAPKLNLLVGLIRSPALESRTLGGNACPPAPDVLVVAN
ncbi:MAG: hypothetical protein KME26_19575 [Oscillatoria princeps RMCB-10]|nr:hypothetical protein [Oscillatoria princeps RMCB-10]